MGWTPQSCVKNIWFYLSQRKHRAKEKEHKMEIWSCMSFHTLFHSSQRNIIKLNSNLCKVRNALLPILLLGTSFKFHKDHIWLFFTNDITTLRNGSSRQLEATSFLCVRTCFTHCEPTGCQDGVQCTHENFFYFLKPKRGIIDLDQLNITHKTNSHGKKNCLWEAEFLNPYIIPRKAKFHKIWILVFAQSSPAAYVFLVYSAIQKHVPQYQCRKTQKGLWFRKAQLEIWHTMLLKISCTNTPSLTVIGLQMK